MYFYINKKTKQIAVVSEGKIKVDKKLFDEKIKEITDEEWKEIDNAKRSFYRNGKIIKEKHLEQEKKDKTNEIKNKLQNNQITEKEALVELLSSKTI